MDELTAESVEVSVEFRNWLDENKEVVFVGTLLVHGPPPQKQYKIRSNIGQDYMIVTREYTGWIERAWMDLWSQIPDEYKTNLAHYKSVFERQRQAKVLRHEFETWVGANK